MPAKVAVEEARRRSTTKESILERVDRLLVRLIRKDSVFHSSCFVSERGERQWDRLRKLRANPSCKVNKVKCSFNKLTYGV